jgi:hypothetical protein
MAIVRKYKETVEDAFIAVLQAHPDLTGLIASGQIRRWDDASVTDNQAAYVLVDSTVAQADPGGEPQTARKQVFVNIRALTYKPTDADASTVNDAFAAIQDKLEDSALLAELIAAVSNTTFFAVRLVEADDDDADAWRWRQVTLDVRLKITPP